CQAVPVAYADWQRASAPPPTEVCAFAIEQPCGAFLLDTFGKDGSTLLDWLGLAEVRHLCQWCRAGGVPIALAGSLGSAEIKILREAQPTWFAVRGAVCGQGRRDGPIDTERVRRLVAVLAGPVRAATCAG